MGLFSTVCLYHTDVRAAVQHLLNVVGYEGKVADRVAELPHVLMETDPEDIQWLKVGLVPIL